MQVRWLLRVSAHGDLSCDFAISTCGLLPLLWWKEKGHRKFTATPVYSQLEVTCFTSAQSTGLTSHMVPTQLEGWEELDVMNTSKARSRMTYGPGNTRGSHFLGH